MKYLVDTNMWIEFFHKRQSVYNHLIQIPPKDIYVSEITIAELTYGAVHSKDIARHLSETQNIIDNFQIVSISKVLRNYADIRHSLFLKNRKNVGDFDILIGATAVYYNYVLVTDNTKDFKDMPDIIIENWIER